MNVEIGKIFGREVLNFPDADRAKIFALIKHIQNHGLVNLEGRNKNSDDVPTDDIDFVAKVQMVQAHNLWHYHIGIVDYDLTKSYGDRTSEYVLHYKNEIVPNEVKIVDFSSHPPFRLPTAPYLED